MKIRSGFVSNSSSSSFIIAADVDVLTVEYLKEVLFNGEERVEPMYVLDHWPLGFDTDFLCQAIVDEMQLINIDSDEVKYAMEDMLDDEPDYPEYDPNDTHEQWMTKLNIYNFAQADISGCMLKQFANNNRGKSLFIGSFSDENGNMYAQIEHGGTFDNLNNITINQH